MTNGKFVTICSRRDTINILTSSSKMLSSEGQQSFIILTIRLSCFLVETDKFKETFLGWSNTIVLTDDIKGFFEGLDRRQELLCQISVRHVSSKSMQKVFAIFLQLFRGSLQSSSLRRKSKVCCCWIPCCSWKSKQFELIVSLIILSEGSKPLLQRL